MTILYTFAMPVRASQLLAILSHYPMEALIGLVDGKVVIYLEK
jgi:hypothetical protein